MARAVLKKQKRKVDSKLFVLAIVLTTLGLVAVADASAPQALSFFSDRFYFLKQQAVWALIGIIVLLVASRIPYSFWEKVAVPAFVVSVLLLIAVLVPGVGEKTMGARRWIILGPVSFQPSEIVKLTLALYLAKLAAKGKGFLSYLIPLGGVCLLIILEPDLGTTLVIAGIGIMQIFVAGTNIFYTLGTIVAGGLAASLAIFVSDYRRDRFLTFLQQTQDPLGKSYHIRQILFALGLGGLFGVGLGESRQKYLFLPEAATDSIFAIIAEEIGFLGAGLLIILLGIFIFRLIKVSLSAPDAFSRVLAAGITAWIGGQIFLNIGSMLALVPLTGIPLPFFSYGGSALTMILLATGILLGISRYESKTTKRKKRK